MKLYAFTYSYDYGDGLEVFPNMTMLVEYAKSMQIPPQNFRPTAHYENRETNVVDLAWFIDAGFVVLKDVDIEAITAKIDERRKQSEEAWEKWMASHTKGGSVTGSCPYHLEDRDQQIRLEIEAATYDWR